MVAGERTTHKYSRTLKEKLFVIVIVKSNDSFQLWHINDDVVDVNKVFCIPFAVIACVAQVCSREVAHKFAISTSRPTIPNEFQCLYCYTLCEL